MSRIAAESETQTKVESEMNRAVRVPAAVQAMSVQCLLLDAGAQVRVLDALLYANGYAIQHLLDRGALAFVRRDYCDPATFAAAARGVSDVVPLASLVGDPNSPKKYPATGATHQPGTAPSGPSTP